MNQTHSPCLPWDAASPVWIAIPVRMTAVAPDNHRILQQMPASERGVSSSAQRSLAYSIKNHGVFMSRLLLSARCQGHDVSVGVGWQRYGFCPQHNRPRVPGTTRDRPVLLVQIRVAEMQDLHGCLRSSPWATAECRSCRDLEKESAESACMLSRSSVVAGVHLQCPEHLGFFALHGSHPGRNLPWPPVAHRRDRRRPRSNATLGTNACHASR